MPKRKAHMSKYHNANLFKKVVDGLKKGEAVMPETRKFTTAGKRKKKKSYFNSKKPNGTSSSSHSSIY